jgi:hypothetical protein
MPGGLVVCASHLVAAGICPPEVFAGKIVPVGTGLVDAPPQVIALSDSTSQKPRCVVPAAGGFALELTVYDGQNAGVPHTV